MMRTTIYGFTVLAALVTVAAGQSSNEQDRVIYLTSIEKPQEMNEVATVIRSIAEIKSMSVDTSQRSLSFHAPAEQARVAELLAKELMAGQSSDAYEYKMSSGDLVDVHYLPHTETVRDFQSIATTVRSITDLRWAFTYNARRAFVVRGTSAQMEMVKWLVEQFNQSDGKAGSNEYPVPDTDTHRDRGADELLHVYFVGHPGSGENLEELANTVRSAGNIRRLYTVGQPMAVAMRGTADEMALGDWLLQKLDQTSSSSGQPDGAARDFRISSSGDLVRVFYLGNVTIGSFQNVAAEVRSAAGAPKVFTYNALGALAVCGTSDQVATAQNLISERFKTPEH
jgi:hypothetical protein